MSEEIHISRQIVRYMTNKKLIEFRDKLSLPPTASYAHVQANGDKDEKGNTIYSNIGIVMLDYSNGTGENTVSVDANISSDELMFIFSKLNQGVEDFRMSEDKIFGDPDKTGRCKVTKLLIARAAKDVKGKPRSFPWFVQVENGTGIKEKNMNTGGFFIKADSYVMDKKVYINLTDVDMHKLLFRVSSYVAVWELTYAPKQVRRAREILQQTKENKA